jgi:hypothetical protein
MPTRFAQVRPEIRLAYEAHGERSAPVVLPILGITDNLTDWMMARLYRVSAERATRSPVSRSL